MCAIGQSSDVPGDMLAISLVHLVAEGCHPIDWDAPLSEGCTVVTYDGPRISASGEPAVLPRAQQEPIRHEVLHVALSTFELQYRPEASLSADAVVGAVHRVPSLIN